MAMIVFTTIYGKHTAVPLETVDVTVVDTDIPENNQNSAATMEQTKNQGDQGQPPADPLIERGVVETDECPF